MGILDDYSGIGMSPRAHRAHSFIMGELYRFVYDNTYTEGFYVFTEEPVTEDRNDIVPDVMMMDKDNLKPVLIIEITNHEALKETKEKSVIYNQRFPNSEVFILDYDKRKWYSIGCNSNKKHPSFSELLDEDLDDGINWSEVYLLTKKNI